jgi:hypothetical protein
MWSVADVADAIDAGLRRRCAQLDEEHAVYGLDTLDEVALHPILAEAIAGAGYGVAREVRYPADHHKRKESHGERCDLVLTPDARPLVSTEAKATLFEAPDAVPFDEAFWLEVKTVAQHTTDGPNGSYSSQLLSTIRQDVTKLSKDPNILHAGLLIVMFVHDARVATHDLGIWQDRCLDRGLPIGAPYLRGIPITDRHGNGHLQVAAYSVSHW